MTQQLRDGVSGLLWESSSRLEQRHHPRRAKTGPQETIGVLGQLSKGALKSITAPNKSITAPKGASER
jgi:hypothetical protein